MAYKFLLIHVPPAIDYTTFDDVFRKLVTGLVATPLVIGDQLVIGMDLKGNCLMHTDSEREQLAAVFINNNPYSATKSHLRISLISPFDANTATGESTGVKATLFKQAQALFVRALLTLMFCPPEGCTLSEAYKSVPITGTPNFDADLLHLAPLVNVGDSWLTLDSFFELLDLEATNRRCYANEWEELLLKFPTTPTQAVELDVDEARIVSIPCE